MTGPRIGSEVHTLSTFAVGEVRWIERTRLTPPIPPVTRRPAFMRTWLFEAAAFMAVPQSSLTADPVRLWRVKRLG